MSLRKAAEMALGVLLDPKTTADEVADAVKTIRQALAQPEQEPVGYVTIENISSWAQVPSIKWFKKPTKGPLYTAPVDAVNMSQERVDEMAKGEHEPFIYVREDNEKPFGGYEHCSEADAGAFPVYTAPPKREWVGLTEWMPIETAPKNGTEVLVMYVHIDTQVVHNGFWLGANDTDDESDIGWWSYEHSEVSRIKLDDWMTPTHWLPLPTLKEKNT